MNELKVIEHKEKRVMTTKVLAEQYDAEEYNITQNFKNNESRFVEGKHYYKLDGEDLKVFKRSLDDIYEPSIKFAPILYLWTEQGAARHAKILDTDRAWEVFEKLEETYFHVRDQKDVFAFQTKDLSPSLQMFNQLFNSTAQNEIKLKKLEHDAQEMRSTIQLVKDTIKDHPEENWRTMVNHMINRIAENVGQNKFKEVRSESYKILEHRAACDLDARLRNFRNRLAEAGETKTRINKVTKLEVIDQDPKLREIYLWIIKELIIKHVA